MLHVTFRRILIRESIHESVTRMREWVDRRTEDEKNLNDGTDSRAEMVWFALPEIEHPIVASPAGHTADPDVNRRCRAGERRKTRQKSEKKSEKKREKKGGGTPFSRAGEDDDDGFYAI